MSWFDEGTRRQLRRRIFLVALVVCLVAVLWGRWKPLPRGLSVATPAYPVPAGSVRFLADATGVDSVGNRVSKQEIFNAILSLVAGAERFIVMDFFLFNEYGAVSGASARDLTRELTEALVQKRKSYPRLPMVLITDPINTVYNGTVSPELTRLRQAGITVVTTDLNRLRDSNFLYSGLWRMTARWLGNQPGGNVMINPFQPTERVSLRSWIALLNFKANHRKLAIADRGSDIVSIVTSLNPHTGSSAHSNFGVEFVNGPWKELVYSEQAVAAFSGQAFALDVSGLGAGATTATSTVSLQVVTEGKIARAVEQALQQAKSGDQIYLSAFYLADRRVITKLVDATLRGATAHVLLDPNKEAFGRAKDGLPNQPVAAELMLHSSSRLYVRWFDTHGEQAHGKMLLVKKTDGTAVLITGSANFTKRNLRDLNLETNMVITGPQAADPLRTASETFERLWGNLGSVNSTAEYARHRDESLWKGIRYRISEWWGLSSW